ncbi:MAG: hypothetical protein HKO59_16735, partial [Phycisphaerales bacterium]|nr:hypothetical protein [Phycisphaerales bacterium]
TFQGTGVPCEVMTCVFFGESCCEEGKPRVLTMLYTGDDCSASSHSQGGAVECDDFGALLDTVYIISSDDDDPFVGDALVWFEGTVSVGEAYDIDAGNAGEDKLKSNTYIHILASEGGSVLQTVKFHTSCSQPVETGDQYGASLLIACLGEHESATALTEGEIAEPPTELTGPAVPDVDLTGDGAVDFNDLVRILAVWGTCPETCPEDLDGSGVVDYRDLLIVLTNWG